MPRFMIIPVGLLMLGLAACAPSSSSNSGPQIQTEIPPTPTVTPAPSPTPIRTPTPEVSATPRPYALIVALTDADGNPITDGSVFLTEANSAFPAVVNTRGLAIWNDLPGETATLALMAQGYVTAGESARLERGQNTVTIVMERDPKQILPAEACQPGEDPLYIEDFEDGQAQGWDWAGQGLPQGWGIEQSSLTGSLVLHAIGGPDEPVYYAQGVIGSYREEFEFLWIRGKADIAVGGWFNLQSTGSVSVEKVRRDVVVQLNGADTDSFQSPEDIHAFQTDSSSEFWLDNIVICRLP
jgi:hypothetical protein